MKNWLLLSLLSIHTAFCLPINGRLLEGSASIRQDRTLLEVDSGKYAHLQWDGFDIGAGERVRFIQTDQNSLVINQIVSPNPSRLMGRLEANGQVVLINPSGLLVGKEAEINTGTLIASALDLIGNTDTRFTFSHSDGVLENSGSIFASKVILLGDHIQHKGIIEANGGIFLSAADAVNLHLDTNPTFTFQKGAQKDVLGIEILGALVTKGEIRMEAPSRTIMVSGSLLGKKVHILGTQNHVYGSALIDVSGEANGGSILIGDAVNSKHTWIAENATLRANSLKFGDGGRIILWADASTYFCGSIEANGGPLGGNGGFVEISSHRSLNPLGTIHTDAPCGNPGTILFDPCAVTLTTNGDSGLSAAPPPYSFNGSTANINITTLNTLLASSNVTIDASASGSALTGSITLPADADMGFGVSWNAGATPTKLTLIADGFIDIYNSIASLSTSASSSTPVIEITAPVVTIGDPSLSVANSTNVGSETGQIQVNASSSLNIYSNAATVQSGLSAGRIGPGAIIVNAGDILIQSGTQSARIVGYDRGVIHATGSVELNGGTLATSDDSDAEIKLSESGTLAIEVGGDLTLRGGSGTEISVAGILTSGGSLDVRVGGDIQLLPGSNTAGTSAAIIANEDNPGSVFLEGANIYLNGGTGGTAMGLNLSLIGQFADGPVTVNATGDTGITATANLGHSAFISTQFSFFGPTPSGDMTINTTNLYLNGATSATGVSSAAFVFVNGNLNLNATGEVRILGGANVASSFAGLNITNAGTVSLNANSLYLEGGSSDGSTASVTSQLGAVSVQVAGSCMLRGGSGTGAIAGIGSASAGGNANSSILASDIQIMGGTGTDSYAGIFTGNPEISVLTGGDGQISIRTTGPGGINLSAGNGSGADALIRTRGDGDSNAISVITGNGFSNLNLMSSSSARAAIETLSGGGIDLTIGNNLNMASFPSMPATISAGAAGASDISIQAGNSAFINSTIQNLGPGAILIAVDQNFPSPFLGPGSFNLGPTSNLATASGAIRIFTSMQQLNTIQGLLNGFSYLPSTTYVDTNQEIWCVYFPSDLKGFPYTIFYKDCVELLASQAQIIIDESLESMHPANEFPGWWKHFTVTYSSDPLLKTPSTHYFITVRQQGVFWNPKSFTPFLHDLMFVEPND